MISRNDMTIRAGAQYLSMVHRGRRRPGGRTMTGLTYIARGNMPRRSCMTAGTDAQHLGMVDTNDRRPDGGRMTRIAKRRGTDM